MTNTLIDDNMGALDALIRAVPDGVLHPGDPDLATAATTLAGRGTPDLVVRPLTAQGAAAAVTYARRHDLPITVRSGGHSMAGASKAAGGLLLDLRRMDDVEVEPETRLVRIGGGACWGRVAQELQPHGLGLTAGDTTGVGVGGLTLGGGIGWMVRRHGLAIDNLVGAQVITADGAIREVSADEHPDLFWALRGGGAGTAVVTRFDFRAQEVADVVFGTMIYAPDDVPALLRRWHAAQRGADDRLTTTFSLMPAMGDRTPAAILGLCFAGPEPDSGPVLGPFLELGTMLTSEISVQPYAEILEDAHHPPGMQAAIDNALLTGLDEATIAALAGLHASGTVVSLRALGGAFSRVERHATAFVHRDAEVMVSAVRFSPGPDAPTLHGAPGWSEVTARGVGSYLNFRSDLTEGVHPAETAARLARIRAEHDPDGLLVNR